MCSPHKSDENFSIVTFLWIKTNVAYTWLKWSLEQHSALYSIVYHRRQTDLLLCTILLLPPLSSSSKHVRRRSRLLLYSISMLQISRPLYIMKRVPNWTQNKHSRPTRMISVMQQCPHLCLVGKHLHIDRALARLLKLPVIFVEPLSKKIYATGETQVERAVARNPSQVGSRGPP